MYSVVLATMLAAGSSTPAWCHSSCYSCYSCYSGYSGYSGYSCYGCHGCHGYRLYPVFHHSYCHGCYSCYSCSSCCGGASYGCCGGVAYSSCYGCSSCCGGTIYSSPPTIVPYGTPPTVVPVPVLPPPAKKSAESPTTSRVIVMLPKDAKLWVDNVECPLTSTVRSFDTPALDPSQKYAYNLKIEVVRDGRTVTQTQRAVITPGQPVQVDFNAGALSTASRE